LIRWQWSHEQSLRSLTKSNLYFIIFTINYAKYSDFTCFNINLYSSHTLQNLFKSLLCNSLTRYILKLLLQFIVTKTHLKITFVSLLFAVHCCQTFSSVKTNEKCFQHAIQCSTEHAIRIVIPVQQTLLFETRHGYSGYSALQTPSDPQKNLWNTDGNLTTQVYIILFFSTFL